VTLKDDRSELVVSVESESEAPVEA
jgi:hypothetical protein